MPGTLVPRMWLGGRFGEQPGRERESSPRLDLIQLRNHANGDVTVWTTAAFLLAGVGCLYCDFGLWTSLGLLLFYFFFVSSISCLFIEVHFC